MDNYREIVWSPFFYFKIERFDNLISITRKEADHLREIGLGRFVKMSSKSHKSRSHHFWLVENPRVLNELEKYKSKIRLEA